MPFAISPVPNWYRAHWSNISNLWNFFVGTVPCITRYRNVYQWYCTGDSRLTLCSDSTLCSAPQLNRMSGLNACKEKSSADEKTITLARTQRIRSQQDMRAFSAAQNPINLPCNPAQPCAPPCRHPTQFHLSERNPRLRSPI